MALIKGKQLSDNTLELKKLKGLSSNPSADQILLTKANGEVGSVALSGDATINSSGVLSLANGAVDSMALISGSILVDSSETFASDSDASLATTSAIKAYVDANAGGSTSISGTANEVEVSGSSGSYTIGLPDNVTISGNLTVSGTTTTVNSTEVSIADKAMVLANGSTDSQIATANGAGLKIGSESSPLATLLYDGVDSFDLSDNLNLASGQAFKIADTTVLDADGAAKVKAAVAGSGLAHSSGVLSLNFNGLTGISGDTIDNDDDLVSVYDDSAGSHIKFTVNQFFYDAIKNAYQYVNPNTTTTLIPFVNSGVDSNNINARLGKMSVLRLAREMFNSTGGGYLDESTINFSDRFLIYDGSDQTNNPHVITVNNLRDTWVGQGLAGNSDYKSIDVKGLSHFQDTPTSAVSVPSSGSTAIAFTSSLPNLIGDVAVFVNGIAVATNAFSYSGGGTPSLSWTSNAPYALETDDVIKVVGSLV